MAAADRFIGAFGRRFASVEKVGAPSAEAWTFVQLADSQLGLLNMMSDPDDWKAEMCMLETAVSKINALRPAPKFVVVCGDLINEFPASGGRPESNEARAEQQVRDFKEAMSHVDASIPLVCVCGNHDVGDIPNRASIDLFASRFGQDYGEFRCGSARCVVLNSQLYSALEPGQLADTEAVELAREQDAWLNSLAADQQFPDVLVFSHIPPFLFHEDEAKGYFNLASEVRIPLLAKVTRLGTGRKAWFSGHFHRCAGAWTKDCSLEVVVTSAVGTAIGSKDTAAGVDRLGIAGMDWTKRACGPHSSGLCVCCVHPEFGIRHKFYTLDQCPPVLSRSSLDVIDIDLADWDGRPPATKMTHHPEDDHPPPTDSTV